METRIIDNVFKVTCIQDNAAPRIMPISLFKDADDTIIEYLGLHDGIPSSVSVFLLEKDGNYILFDAGLGASDSRMPYALNKLGIKHDDIDYVYITHMHADHIGGMILGDAAAFTKAEVYIYKNEYDAWMNMPLDKNVRQRNFISAYGERIHLFTDNVNLPGGIQAIAAHGHTPGHMVYRSGSLLIVGDILHGAALQLLHPEICAMYDMDKSNAILSRKRVLKYASDNHLLMCGVHFPHPAFIEGNFIKEY